MQHSRIPRLARLLCVLVGLAAVPAVQAQYLDRGWTLELGAGKTTFKDVDKADLDAVTRDFFGSFTLPVQTLSSTLDTRDRSLAVQAGYRFNRWLAADVGFFSLGSFQYASTGTVDDVGTIRASSFNFGYHVKAITIGGTATLPLGRNFELRARAGISNSDVQIKYSATVDTDTLNDKYSDTSQDLYYGVGAGIVVWDYYRIGVDYLHHDKLGKASSTGTTSVDNVMLTLGFRY
jgi:Outer membrane protein beta-barrel domain